MITYSAMLLRVLNMLDVRIPLIYTIPDPFLTPAIILYVWTYPISIFLATKEDYCNSSM